jgi:hypothetical protein
MPVVDETPGITDLSAFNMQGITGIQRYGAISKVYEEFLRELQGPQGMKSLREMADNDPISGAILFAANHLCRKVKFRFRPPVQSAEAQAIADFVGGAIFDDLESTWPDTLSEILTMLPFGWALMEFDMKRRLGMSESDPNIVPGERSASTSFEVPPVSQVLQGNLNQSFVPSKFNDGMIGFRSWSLRAQETLHMWEFDDRSNAIVMEQIAPPDYRLRRIPLTKAFLFRTTVSKNNPEGRSILRNAWTSYYFKKNLQVFEGIGIERDLAGYPVIQTLPPDMQKGMMPPDVWNEKDQKSVQLLATLQKIVRSVRRDEQEGLVLPWWAEFKLMSTGSKRSFDTNAIISRYDQRISMSVMADFIMLGHEAVGSKALAATKISLFTSGLSAFLDNVCAIITRRAVPILMRFNGMPQELAPIMEHGDVESVNLEELGNFIAKIAGTGFNPLADPNTQRVVMELARLPTTGVGPLEIDPTKDPEGKGGKDPEGKGKETGDKGSVEEPPSRTVSGGRTPVTGPQMESGTFDTIRTT